MSDKVWHLLLLNRLFFFFLEACDNEEGLGNTFVTLWVMDRWVNWMGHLIYKWSALVSSFMTLCVTCVHTGVFRNTVLLLTISSMAFTHLRDVEAVPKANPAQADKGYS